jgi:DNA (cytosine-5)-methyltransferase 1
VRRENGDGLIKSPASQRGRDFGIIVACCRDLGYIVEWRVINAAEYGYQQRRRRTFIFAYRDDTKYAGKVTEKIGYNRLVGEELRRRSIGKMIGAEGFFANSFPIESFDEKRTSMITLPDSIGELSSKFSFTFENTGVMRDGVVYTVKTTPDYNGHQITLGEIMEDGDVDKSFFIPKERLYYTNPEIDHSDETKERLSEDAHRTWQYVKGAKKLPRQAQNGHEYIFSEGPVTMIDEYDKPARTMLTSEGSFNRTTHIVRDKKTGEVRLLTPIEVERIQGFPSDWTKECLVDGEKVEMPVNKRRFMMGNALVVNLINQMEPQLSKIFDEE